MNTKQGTWDAASDAVKEVFADCAPKPRAGEHGETRAEQEMRLNAKLVDAMGYPAYAASWESIARSACAERDLLRERERELVEALRDLLDRVDRNGGLGEYKGGVPFATKTARELLAKHGR
jgi:hypothetical protein